MMKNQTLNNIAWTLKDDLIFNLAQIGNISTSLRRFKFIINNTVNSTLPFKFELNTTGKFIASNINISLASREDAMIYIENNFTMSGLHEIKAIVRSGDYYDDKKIYINI